MMEDIYKAYSDLSKSQMEVYRIKMQILNTAKEIIPHLEEGNRFDFINNISNVIR